MPYILAIYGIYSDELCHIFPKCGGELGIFSKWFRNAGSESLPEKRGWSVWFVITKQTVSLVAAENLIDDAIPEDGSFESAWLIQWDLTESEADEVMGMISHDLEEEK